MRHWYRRASMFLRDLISTRPVPKDRLTRRARPAVEVLEARLAPALILVTNGTDDGDDQNPTNGTLRWAIKKANSDAGEDLIKFELGAGNRTISIVDCALPAITDRVIIDAAAKPRLFPTQTITITRGNLLEQSAELEQDGLRFYYGSSGSKVMGLTIDGFQNDGIAIHTAANITIGGAEVNQGNTITSNKHGIFICTPDSTNISIYGNFIGTNAQSAPNLGNFDGIVIFDGPRNVLIGSLSTEERNVISGNIGDGIRIVNASLNYIRGNYIGTNVAGTEALINKKNGIVIEGQFSVANVIGTVVPTEKGVITTAANVISGNRKNGIVLQPTGEEQNGPEYTKIVGNYIGTDKTGTKALGNQNNGILLHAALYSTIGSTALGEANVISSNEWEGIRATSSSKFNRIEGNAIGTGKDPADNAVKLRNKGSGISLGELTSKNVVVGNTVKNNGLIQIDDDSKKNKIEKNTISRNGAPGNGLGIDIGAEGVTTDNMPTLSTAIVAGLTTVVTGFLDGATPDSTFVVEFFGNSVLHSSGHGEGERFLGETTVTTDANGGATFSVTLDGVYGSYVAATATRTDEDGFTSEFSQSISLSGAGSLASVGNRVWNDLDGNGLQDSGEIGVQGVTVELYTAAGVLALTDITDVEGEFLFTDLNPGDYYLRFIAPVDHSFTIPYQGFWQADSNAEVSTGLTEVFTLTAGEHNPHLDAGLLFHATGTATVEGRTWSDWNADGIQDAGELGLDEVAVSLYRADGLLLATVLTASDGVYEFASLAPGDYFLVFAPPANSGYSFSPQDQGTDDTQDSDVDPLTGQTAIFTLDGGAYLDHVDAGLFLTVSIAGRAWVDSNANGIQEEGEEGLAGVLVHLCSSTGEILTTVETDEDGFYQFTSVVPGSYYLQFVRPTGSGYVFSPQDQGTDNELDSDVDGDGLTARFALLGNGLGLDLDLDAGLHLPI